MIRRFIALCIFLFGALWTSPAIFMLFALGSAGAEANEDIAALAFGMHAIIFIIPGLILIGLGTLVWPKKERS